jgi:hypothetical protein
MTHMDAHRLQFEPGVSAAVRRSTSRVADGIASLLKRGQGQGAIRSDVSPLSLAWLVVSLIQARQLRRRFSPASPTVLEDDLLVHVLQALRPRQTARRRRHQGSLSRALSPAADRLAEALARLCVTSTPSAGASRCLVLLPRVASVDGGGAGEERVVQWWQHT